MTPEAFYEAVAARFHNPVGAGARVWHWLTRNDFSGYQVWLDFMVTTDDAQTAEEYAACFDQWWASDGPAAVADWAWKRLTYLDPNQPVQAIWQIRAAVGYVPHEYLWMVDFIEQPVAWHLRPILPLRHAWGTMHGISAVACLHETLPLTVLRCNMLDLERGISPQSIKAQEVYPSARAIVASGWLVD